MFAPVAEANESLGESQRCRDLEDRLIRSEQRAFERLQQIADTCEEAQHKYADLVEKYNHLGQEHQLTLVELEEVRRLSHDQRLKLAEVYSCLEDLQAKLPHGP